MGGSKAGRTRNQDDAHLDPANLIHAAPREYQDDGKHPQRIDNYRTAGMVPRLSCRLTSAGRGGICDWSRKGMNVAGAREVLPAYTQLGTAPCVDPACVERGKGLMETSKEDRLMNNCAMTPSS